MPVVAARGLRFHVQELGAGPSVVMIHGLLIGSLASWFFTAAPTLARHRRVRLYDLRGHGRSERVATGYDLRTMAADLAALSDDLPGPIDLVGHSWGGLIALRFALERPKRVRSLTIVEAPLPPAHGIQLSAILGDTAIADDGVTPERLIAALPPSLQAAVAGGRRQAERLFRSLHFLAMESSLLADLRSEPDVADAELASLHIPALCIYGDRSACLPAGRRLAAALPDARLLVLPGGHYLHLDAREALIGALESHLDGLHLDG